MFCSGVFQKVKSNVKFDEVGTFKLDSFRRSNVMLQFEGVELDIPGCLGYPTLVDILGATLETSKGCIMLHPPGVHQHYRLAASTQRVHPWDQPA